MVRAPVLALAKRKRGRSFDTVVSSECPGLWAWTKLTQIDPDCSFQFRGFGKLAVQIGHTDGQLFLNDCTTAAILIQVPP